jgi:hypothetical protein
VAEVFSTADVASLLSVKPWQVRRLFEDRTLPEPDRIGNQRAIPRAMVAQIATALRDRGFLPAQEGESENAQ